MAQALHIATTAVAAVGTLASSAMSAAAARAEGRAAKQAGDFQAAQLEQRAGQERAASQREAIEHRRASTRAQSRAIALAAASGGGASDPSVTSILGNLEAEGDYNAEAALYGGEESARGMETSAAAARYEGDYADSASKYAAKATRRAGYLSTIGTLTSGATSFYDKYWPDPTLSDNTKYNPSYTGGGKFGSGSSQAAYR